MNRISSVKVTEIKRLRLIGNSIPEIARATGCGKTTVLRYVKEIKVPDEYRNILREKQGGAKQRAIGLRENMLTKASEEIGSITDRDRFFLLVGLYWGEGTKRDFGVINSDPLLIQALLRSFQSLGIEKTRLSLSLRVHRGIDIPEAKSYWSKITSIPVDSIGSVEVIDGKKTGKLPYGMCRIRVRSGIRERLLIQSAIAIIGKDSSKKVVSA